MLLPFKTTDKANWVLTNTATGTRPVRSGGGGGGGGAVAHLAAEASKFRGPWRGPGAEPLAGVQGRRAPEALGFLGYQIPQMDSTQTQLRYFGPTFTLKGTG